MADDDVGYGKPPRHSQFKKGRSGNPNGRPKGSKSVVSAVQRALSETVVINENGRRKTISKLDAAAKQLVNKAATGDPRSIQHLLGLVTLLDGHTQQETQSPLDTDADRQVMKNFRARLMRELETGNTISSQEIEDGSQE